MIGNNLVMKRSNNWKCIGFEVDKRIPQSENECSKLLLINNKMHQTETN